MLQMIFKKCEGGKELENISVALRYFHYTPAFKKTYEASRASLQSENVKEVESVLGEFIPNGKN